MEAPLPAPFDAMTHDADIAGESTEYIAGAQRRPSTNAASRMIAVLDTFGGPLGVLGVSDVALAAGVPKSTAHRMLGILLAQRYIERVGNRYRLASRVFELGSHVSGLRRLRDIATPYMTELHRETLSTVHLAVLDGPDVLYVEKIFGHGGPPCPTTVGGRNRAHATALGKALLSRTSVDLVHGLTHDGRLDKTTPNTVGSVSALLVQLSRARDEGFATETAECRPGLSCVAAPILDWNTGRPIAAISVSTSAGHVNSARFRQRVHNASQLLSDRLTSSHALC